MATTYDALISGENVAIDTCITIEGFSYILTTGSASAAVTAYSGSDWGAALSGVSVFWKLSSELHPWEPLRSGGGTLSFAVQDADGSDVFGIATHRKTATDSSPLAADALPGASSITVKRSDDFAAGQAYAYVGAEAFSYDTNDTGTDTFSDLTRGVWSPFETEIGDRFARSHRVNSTIPGVNLAPDVTDIPTEWLGRWVAVRLHRRLGSTLDTLAESHLAYAGRIASIRDSEDGQTVVELESVIDVIANTAVFREPWRAALREGVWLQQGAQFTLDTQRVPIGVGTVTGGSADPLTVVPSGASGAYEIDEGFYSAAQVQFYINRWMADAYAGSDTVLATTFTARAQTTEGVRSAVEWSDGVGSAGSAIRTGALKTNSTLIAAFMGWEALTLEFGGLDASGTNYSANVPERIATVVTDSASEVEYHGATGSWFDQENYIPTVLANGGFTKGVVKVGNAYYLAGTPSGGTIELRRSDVLNKLAGQTPAPFGSGGTGILEIQQVLVLEGSFFGQFQAFLFSTGDNGFNGTFDLFPEHVGLGIPFSIATSALATELANAPGAGTQRTVIIEKPTTFASLFEWAFTVRHMQLVWGNGRLSLAGWATPTTGATLTVTEAMKHVPVGQRDNAVPVAAQSDQWLRNVIKIDFDRLPFQDVYQSSHVIDHKASQNASGARAITIKARDAVSGGGLLGEDLSSLLPSFIAGLPFLTKPVHIVRVPISFSQFITHRPGQSVLFTDTFLRDPSTGTRGVTGKPALIVGAWYDWGGGETNGKPRAPQGELTLMLFPGRSLAPYTATAHIDDTAPGGGLSASVITCYPHRYSESSDPVDVSRFAANYLVRIRERDPSNPAAPLEWQPVTVLSVNAGANTMTLDDPLAGFDSSKRYVVEFTEYANTDPNDTQDEFCYQADDADALVQDFREAYAYAYFGVGQVSAFTEVDATDLPERHVNSSFGDGAPLTTGDAFAIARNLNNAVNFATAPQVPFTYTEQASFGTPPGSETWSLARVEIINVGKGILSPGPNGPRTRKLNVGVMFKTDGTSGSVRVTLCRDLTSTSASHYDVDRPAPYVEHTFTASSSSNTFPSATQLDIAHLRLGDELMGGVGYLLIEVTQKAVFIGLSECWLGPLEDA